MRFIFLLTAFSLGSCAQTGGPLLLAGGGDLSPEIFEKGIQLVRKEDVHILIFPQASQREEAGFESAEAWLEAGAKTAHVANLSSPETNKKNWEEILNADILWFTGGSQLRLMEAVQKAQILPAIQQRWRQGAVVGGTSAGAAVMGSLIISGSAQPQPLMKGAMTTHRGFGLCPQFLVDQHFTQRNRHDRLLTAILDHSEVIGVGISERTVFVIQGNVATVWGDGPVHLYDARNANIPTIKVFQSAHDISFTLLRSGSSYSW